MDYRMYLTNNAKNIIENNRLNANKNCYSKFKEENNNISFPVLFKSVSDKPLQENSDLKQTFLDYYVKLSGKFSPGIIKKPN